ncbi:hypothetical protein D3C75_1188460 [compost metagenome]
MNLPVDVRDIHHVFVNQDDPANAAAGKCFYSNPAHTADAKYGYRAISERIQTFWSDRKLCS